jgi:ABC-type multidrug transport system permease subunit
VNAFVVLTRMRIRDVLRKKSSAAFMFVFPIVLVAGVGFIFVHGHPFERRTVLIVDRAPSAAGRDALVRALRGRDEIRVEPSPSLAEAMGRLRSRMAAAVLVREPAAGGGARVRLLVGPRDELFGLGAVEVLPAPVELEVEEAPPQGYVHYLFPGLLTYSVLLAGLFGMGHTMVRYRQTLFLKKLATTPLRRSTFIAAQIVARAVLVLGQVLLMIGAAALLFDLPVTAAALGWLVVISLLGLLTFMGAGFALACVVKTEDLVVDVISAVTLPLVLLGETFFPADSLPAPLPAIAEALPPTHMARLARAVLLYGESDPVALLPGLAVLGGWAVVTFAVSLLVFRWHD